MKGTVGKQATLGPPSHWLVGLGVSCVWAGQPGSRVSLWVGRRVCLCPEHMEVGSMTLALLA